MNYLIRFFLLFTTTIAVAQSKYITKSGNLNFEASVPAFEEVAAKSKSVTTILDTNTGKIASLIFVKGFRFKNALMEEHFNENYIESTTFPKANFKGKIEGFIIEKATESSDNYKISGQLTIHGETKTIEAFPIKYNVNGNSITLSGDFSVLASDFNIKIPSIVKKKVSDKVKISFVFELQQKQ